MAEIIKEESSDVDLNGDIDDKFCVQSETESTHNIEDTRITSSQILQYIIRSDRIIQPIPENEEPLRPGQTRGGEHRPNEVQNTSFTICEAVFGIVSIVLFYVDVVTDIMLANEYFHQGNKLWFGLTTAFIVVPSISTCFLNLRQYVLEDNKGASKYLWVTRLTMTLLMMGPIIRQIEYLYHGLKSRGKEKKDDHYEKMKDANTVACNLRMFECVLEAAPQLVLQIYILTSQTQHESWHIGSLSYKGRQVAAILSSFVGLAWSLVAVEKADWLISYLEIHTLKGLVFLFLCRASEIGPRVIALGLFASQFHSFVFIVTVVHFISMSIWFFFKTENSVVNTLLKLLYGIVVIFCFLRNEDNIKRYKVLVYYIITFLENFIMVGIWSYFTDSKGEWFYIPTFFVMPLSLVLCVFSGIMYFGYFHPSGKRRILSFHQMGIRSCYQYLCDGVNYEIGPSRVFTTY